MGRRLLSILLGSYVLLVLYASLMPLEFSATEAETSRAWETMWRSWPLGDLRLSGSDALANVMIYIPLGLLLATRLTLGRRHPAAKALAIVASGVFAGCLSMGVELLQLLIPMRVPAASDLVLNVAGTLAGAVPAGLWGPTAWQGLYAAARRRWHHRPLSLAAAVLILAQVASAWYPWVPALGPAGVWRNVQNSTLDLSASIALHGWDHWLIARSAAWALLTLLLAGSSRSRGPRRWVRAAVAATVLAVLLELSKPLARGHTISVANPLFSAAGAIVAATVGGLLAGRLRRGALLLWGAAGIVGYLVWLELRPFAFDFSPETILDALPRGRSLLPLYHYAMGARMQDVYLFGRTVLLCSTAAALLRIRFEPDTPGGRRLRTALGLGLGFALLGALLEGLQLALPSRVASTTDVTCFAIGGALGAWPKIVRRAPAPTPAPAPRPITTRCG
jgi:VanZ family protein